MKGHIHSFESLATLEGSGVRYGVFLQGCPLRCVYCHNPDTQRGGGEEYTPEVLVNKIVRYKPYFKTNGGVTFSGGEPLCQSEFIKECIPLLRQKEISYVIDTSGAVKLDEAVKEVLRNSQMVILDLKFWDNESYLRYTGQDMTNTLEVLRFLDDEDIPVWVRTVVIPGINDTEEIVEKYIPYIKAHKCIKKYELLAFHTMGFHKYEALGMENPLADTPDLEKSIKERLQDFVDKKLNI